ncbi:MAG: hypothetical protein WCS52_09870 [bacterium]
MKEIVRRMLWIGAASVLWVGGSGCQSMMGPASASFASVTIGGYEPREVIATTIKVFESHGYKTIVTGENLIFEREGSQWDQTAYAIGGSPVVNRVRAQVVDLGGAACRVQCTAYIVRDPGTSYEDAIRLQSPRSGPYREMMNEVMRRMTDVTIVKP